MLVGETLASVVVPVPETATVCGLPAAPSVIVMAAERLPVAEGVKVTLIVQLAPAATLNPQVLVWAKLLALVPDTVMLVMLKSAVPVFVSVTVCAALLVPTVSFPKATLEGETLTADAVPVPERVTVWGLFEALSVTVTVAARDPVADGLKTTLIAQFAPAATDDPQLLVWVKSLALAPEITIPVRFNAALPEFDNVIA